jgi:Ca2+-transporting ATPase
VGISSSHFASNRRLDNKFNIFEGIHRNYFFIGINIIMISGQLLIVFFGGEALSTEPLNATQWGISLGLGALSLVVAVIVRLIPDELIRKFMHKIFPRTHASYIKINSNPRFRWNDTIENVRDELSFFKSIRGRHWNGFFASQDGPRTPLLSSTEDMNSDYSDGPGELADALHTRNSSPRRGLRSKSASALAPAAVMAGVIAGSIAGWNPREISSAENDS